MEKISIKNRSGLHIVVLLEKNENSKGIVFIVHGLGGNKEQPQISAFAEVFAKKIISLYDLIQQIRLVKVMENMKMQR